MLMLIQTSPQTRAAHPQVENERIVDRPPKDRFLSTGGVNIDSTRGL